MIINYEWSIKTKLVSAYFWPCFNHGSLLPPPFHEVLRTHLFVALGALDRVRPSWF